MLWGGLVTKVILCEFRADQCKWPKECSLQRLVSPIPWGVRASRCRALPDSPLTPVILACRCRETQCRENRGDAVWAAAWHPPGKIIPSLLHPACNWEALLGGQAGPLLWTHIFTDSSRVILPVQTFFSPVAMYKNIKRGSDTEILDRVSYGYPTQWVSYIALKSSRTVLSFSKSLLDTV